MEKRNIQRTLMLLGETFANSIEEPGNKIEKVRVLAGSTRKLTK